MIFLFQLTYEAIKLIDRDVYNLVDSLSISSREDYFITTSNEDNDTNVVIVKQENAPTTCDGAAIEDEESNDTNGSYYCF